MKISQETIDNLKYFQRIGQSMKFKEGADYITIIGGDTIGVADITEVFPRDVNIYDLGEFMSLISISKEPDIDVSEDNVIQISNDDFTIRYIEGVSTNIKTLKEKPTIKSMHSIFIMAYKSQRMIGLSFVKSLPKNTIFILTFDSCTLMKSQH